MIAVDTNILVRYFAEDDPVQTQKARRFLEHDSTEESPAFVTLVTLVELIWVLNDTYKIGKPMQSEVVRELLDAPRLVIEQDDIVRAALELNEGDIADRIIHLCGVEGGCTKTVTFDKKFARLNGVELLA
jgi:predicted nucleic-acid-binding protein